MKKSKSKLINMVLSVAIIVFSLAFCIIDFSANLDVWTHPILNFLFGIFLGFGLLFTIGGFCSKSTLNVMLGTIMLSLAIVYLTIQYLPWYIALICSVCYALCISIVSNTLFGNKTDLADNSSSDYKSIMDKQEQGVEKEEVELPKIKSFK